MRIQEIMSSDVQCAMPDTTLSGAAALMRDLDVGALPVCDNERLIGMVTDRDIVVRAVAEGRSSQQVPVVDVMSQDLVWCYDDADVSEAAKLMQERQIRRLPILNRDRRLVGIVSLGDLAVRGNDERLSGHTLEQVSENGSTSIQPQATTAGATSQRN